MLLICYPLVPHIRRFGQLQQEIKQFEGGVSNGQRQDRQQQWQLCQQMWLTLARMPDSWEGGAWTRSDTTKHGRRCEAEEPQKSTINRERMEVKVIVWCNGVSNMIKKYFQVWKLLENFTCSLLNNFYRLSCALCAPPHINLYPKLTAMLEVAEVVMWWWKKL